MYNGYFTNISACETWGNGVNIVLYWPVQPEFFVPAPQLVQKHSYFVLLFVPKLTRLYWQNREKSQIPIEKRIPNDKSKTRIMEIK